MKCPSCGAEANREAVYCHTCGARLDDGEAVQVEGASEPRAEPAAETSSPAAPPSAADRVRASVGQRRQSASEEETELWEGSYSPKAMAGAFVASAVATIALVAAMSLWARNATWWLAAFGVVLLVWLVPLLTVIYRRFSIHYRLTNHRFYHEMGILRRVTHRINVIDMNDISFERTLLGRLLNVGCIHIISSDRSHPELRLHGIEDVRNVAMMMDNARRKERIQRGLHIEAG